MKDLALLFYIIDRRVKICLIHHVFQSCVWYLRNDYFNLIYFLLQYKNSIESRLL